MTPTWLLAAAMALPVFKEDRTAPNKPEQLAVIARAVDEAASEARGWQGSRRELAALMLSVGYHESRFSLRIHAGQCRPYECDRGRARGLWQQHASSASSYEAWERLHGLDDDRTLFAAREAARALVRARGACRSLEARGLPWLEMTLSSYAGRGCIGYFRGREARVATFRRLMRRAGA